MKKSYNSLALTLTICMVFLFFSFSLNAQVGVGTTTPDAQLDIVAPAATGNALQVNDDNTTNGSSSVWVRNSGLGYGINLQTLNTGSNFPSMGITQFGTGAISRGLDINMDATTGAYALAVFQNGAGDGIYNQINGSGIVGVYNDLSDHGGIGDFVDLDDNDGTGVLVYGVDNGAAPTSGGDVFAFNGIVRTNTATGAFVNGGVLAGQQFGVGHGAIITHSGTAGRNAEFNITNAANADAAIFSVHLGQGSAIVAQNQNNALTGTIAVADFAYTGTDLDDHVGVSGFSAPAAFYGIGVEGTGDWYGVHGVGGNGYAVFATGDFAATGGKLFLIDHPEDPANKMLKHFAIESNEVLNMYRGVEAFDANGKAIVSLPDYYDSININPSYQLTPIGAAMPNLYIESEIGNGQFVIAGGVPNKKVSWQITAERNDPYFQQNPEKRNVVLNKVGNKKGKYLTPELYGQPKEAGINYRKPKTHKASKVDGSSNTKQLEDRKAESAEAIKEEKVEDKK